MRCPRCKQEVNLVDMILDNDLQTLFSCIPQFGPHSRLAWEYCELFDVVPVGKKMKKLARLLAEVAALFAAQKFRYQKREYQVSTAGIVEGLKTVCNKGFDRPLENHNYLKKVLISLSDNERKAARNEADAAQRAREAAAPFQRPAQGGNSQPEPGMTLAEFKKRQGLDSLVDKIGSRI